MEKLLKQQEYGLVEKELNFNKSKKIIFIGEIIESEDIEVLNFEGIPIGFFDNKHNLITTILLHPYNLSFEFYKDIFTELTKCLKKGSKKFIPEHIVSLINILDQEGVVYQSFSKYIVVRIFEPPENTNFTKDDFDFLIKLISEDTSVLKEYTHLSHLLLMKERSSKW
jgi:hypothetical protein